MPLFGQALVGKSAGGIQPGQEDAYLAWHTYEHMPSGSASRDFCGRRFRQSGVRPHPTFTLYEGAHIETFRSPGYLARLNKDPTEWSNRVQPTMTSFSGAAARCC